MINRSDYINQLINYKDTKTIKVITGMRRSGKSTILQLFIKNLLNEGVNEKNIININFDSLENNSLKDYLKLYNYIKDRIISGEKNYIFLDEIQNVLKWEEVVNSLLVDFENVDIYITGSNAYLLSSDLSTLLSGRYIEINILPLSFKEYLNFSKEYYSDENQTIEESFNDYIRYGSLPILFEHKKTDSIFKNLLSGVYNTVLIKDIIQRNNIHNTLLLENIVKFALDNIGNIISSKSISKYLKNEGITTTPNTVLQYLNYLDQAYIFYSVKRFNLKGKNYLKTLKKQYVTDIGIRNGILGFRNVDFGHILENIVFLELKRRGYDVAIGKYGNYEIDFVVSNLNTRKYYQVCESIKDKNVLKRELKSLESIKDNYEKIILSMDKTFATDQNGIKFQNIIDFLLE